MEPARKMPWAAAPSEKPDAPVSFEGQEVSEELFLELLDEAVDALRSSGVPFAAMGGIASSMYGRERWTHDVDFFVRDHIDASTALRSLESAGFATQETNPHWLFKGIKRGVLVDLLFRAKGDIYYDEEMVARTRDMPFKGRRTIPVIPPEDLIVIKAIIHDEETPRHWYDALGIIAATDLDWPYLLRRSRRGPRRMLSLLLYAQSNDLVVPDQPIRELFEAIFDV